MLGFILLPIGRTVEVAAGFCRVLFQMSYVATAAVLATSYHVPGREENTAWFVCSCISGETQTPLRRFTLRLESKSLSHARVYLQRLHYF